ncbi:MULTISPECIES: permease-like cell division protein FtsX [unclassified Gilliamella]|uniref:permease-like cell division protein FtsX n=1 Tax=unclassified Gilliamella TaxID=2685620 RepID=UPI002269FE3A|nr:MULTISPECIES: permease-like cell division protein FtsX [unclassified Gilliamella]MCX8584110.1 permease-like cell division protein FtsX [Gilliamella sp. B3372]MCX8595476.1 permease-like cell division protein FtsX [Gilliamella sp. B3367]MCX8663650.1 permease-like cell division protein FtsX [Gilliamella sp. B2911]MCX8671799.1 permease-like cell division protein FtsX [Gilliamella sp. B2785]MCX8680128.1 permease-like cell division protein FtsX [Gilliamella sp. B2865]
MIKAKIKPSKQKKNNSFLGRWKRQIGYAWHNVFNYFYQNIFASLLTIFVIAISITLPTIGYLLLKNANQAAEQWYPTPNVTVYINKTLTPEQTNNLIDQFKTIPEVQNVTYLSRDETRDEFKTWSGFDDALDLLADNPLPAVAIIFPVEEAKQTNKLHDLQARLRKIDGVDDVQLDDSWFTRLTALTNMVKSIVWTISIFMIIAVSLVIGNSIRLNIFARRQTIMVMQLIGATEGFILRPFLYNGIFTGLISAILALVLSKVFILQIDSTMLHVSDVFGTIVNINGLSWDESLLIILFSMIIGWFSAFIATKKYLNKMVIAS